MKASSILFILFVFCLVNLKSCSFRTPLTTIIVYQIGTLVTAFGFLASIIWVVCTL